MAEQIVIQIDDSIPNSIEQKIIAIGTAAKTSNTAIEKLQKNLNVIDKNALATERLAAAQNRTQATAARLSAASDRAAIAHLRLEAAQKRQEASARSVAASNASVGNSLGSLITRGLQIAAAYIGIREVVNSGNAFLDLQNKIKVVTNSEAALNEVSTHLFDISNNTRISVESTTRAFSRFDMALKPLGKSQEEVLRMTETVNKALTISGASVEEQSAGLLQLSQAFNKGKLDGDEFRSVMELMPAVADAIAKQLKVTRGELLNLAPQGKITADVMSRALSEAAISIDAKFAKTVPTLRQSLTVLKNSAIETFGEIEKQTSALSNAAGFITYTSDGFKYLSYDIALVINPIEGIIKEFSILAGGSDTASNSMMFLQRNLRGVGYIAAVVAESVSRLNYALHQDDVTVALYNQNEALKKYNELKLQIEKRGENAGTNKELRTLLAQAEAYGKAGEAAAKMLQTYTDGKSYIQKWGEAIEKSDENIKKITETQKKLEPIKKLINETATSYEELAKNIELAEKIKNKNSQDIANLNAAKKSLEEIRKQYDEAVKAKNKLLGVDNLRPADISIAPPIDKKELADQETRAKLIARISAELKKESDAFGMVGPEREAYLKLTEIELRLGDRKLKNSKEGIKLTYEQKELFKQQILENENNKKIQSEAEKIYEDSSSSLLKLNNTIAANSLLLTNGYINQDQFNKQLLIAKNVYINAVDPLHEINKQLAQESELLNFVGREQQIENRMQQIRNDLLTKGTILTTEQETAYKNEIQAILQKNLVNQEANRIYNETLGKEIALNASYTALNQSLSAGTITQGQYSLAVNKLAIDMANLKIARDKFTINDLAIASLGSLVSNYKGAVAELTDVWGNYFKSLEDGFANSIGKAIVEGESLRDLLNDVAKNALEGLISGLVKVGIQYLINAAIGTSAAQAALAANTAASVAAATTTAAAWAPAAALTSLASFGANSAPAVLGMGAAAAFSEGIALAGVAGFERGGIINGGEQLIRVNEKGTEMVMNAPATAKNRPILEAMNKGGSVAAGPAVSVKIENYGTSKSFEVEQIDKNEIRIIARDEAKQVVQTDVPNIMASEIANPNSKSSKSLANNTTVSRRR